MSEPDLNLLVSLDALLTNVSVAGAARKLGLSASAMSRTLMRLREATGDPLLVRAGRRMVLTPAAEALRERVRQAVHEARALLRPSGLEPDIARLQRTFTIRANGGFVEGFGAALLAAISAEAPFVRLRFAPKIDKTSAYLRDGSADLEIGVVGNMGPEVRVQALFRDHYVGVVRRGHPLASGQMTAERYAAASHVVASRRGTALGPVDTALAALGLERQVVAVVPGFPSALGIARASDLVALLPASYMPIQPADCWVFDLPVSVEGLTISQMWHPRAEADPAHRWLRQLVLAVCRARIPL
ncbi:MAG: LysR family transcriptional regulator [Pseudomonadota bacterium]|nr:LysR family transcriptional regulator [Pseudomonadota bacterium]